MLSSYGCQVLTHLKETTGCGTRDDHFQENGIHGRSVGRAGREWVKTAERLSSADWVEINAEVKVRIGILTEEGCTEGPAGTAGEASTAAGSSVDARACIEL